MNVLEKYPLYNVNREGWMGNELGSNWKGIEEVFGEEELKRFLLANFIICKLVATIAPNLC